MKARSLKWAVAFYLQSRRRLGFALESEGGLLQNLVAYAHQLGHRGALTTELALNWAQVPPPANPLQRARRLVPCGTSRSFGPPSTPAHKSRCSWAMNRRPPRTITSNWTSK